MLLSDQLWCEILVQLDFAQMGSTHFSEDGFCQFGFSRIEWKEDAAEYLQVANAGSIRFDLGSDETVFLHVLGPVFLVLGGFRDGRLQLPHGIEWCSFG